MFDIWAGVDGPEDEGQLGEGQAALKEDIFSVWVLGSRSVISSILATFFLTLLVSFFGSVCM